MKAIFYYFSIQLISDYSGLYNCFLIVGVYFYYFIKIFCKIDDQSFIRGLTCKTGCCLLYTSTVHIESEEKGKEVSSGDFHITEFTIYNKPIVTKEDTDFIDLFERVTQYYRIHHADTDVYRFLELYSGEDILLFAQKK